MLSNLIRRNGKRKGNAGKAIEPRCHQKSFSTSESCQVASPLVFDINEESLAAQRSPVVELNFSASNEDWFPRELLRSRSCSPSSPSSRGNRSSKVTRDTSAQETRTNPSPVPSPGRSENASPSIASRKKSIPAPIMIPDLVAPNVRIGQSSARTGELPPGTSPSNVKNAPLNPPSPSASDNLSSISGTTLARALIASSFVLSSLDRRSSRHRSGIARQDSATLPRGSFFLSEPESSSPIPPVPPVPTMLASISPDPNHSSTIKSGASTESEYPMSDAYITSPETTSNSTIPQRISRVDEIPSSAEPTSSKIPPSVFIGPKLQRRAGPFPARARVRKNSMFDGPKTAVEVPLPINHLQRARNLSQEDSVLLSSDDHSLDEFDFLPPEHLAMATSPESDSSASCIAPLSPQSRRGDLNRSLWKRRAGGLNLIRNGSKVSLSDGTFASQQAYSIPSASTSEHDYGELLNYDLTVSPEPSLSSSGASAGYQTFPETPVGFSPLWSSGMRSAGKPHSNMKTVRRRVGTNDDGVIKPSNSQSSSSPSQKTSSLKQAEPELPPSVPTDDDACVPEDKTNTTNDVQSQHPGGPLPTLQPHPLSHISSSSSYVLGEKALRALAKHSPSSSTSVIRHVSVKSKSPTSIPLPESTDVSPFNSPALGGSSVVISSSESSLRLSPPTTSTVISQPRPSKSLSSPPTPPRLGSSFLPSVLPSPLSDKLPSRTHSQIAAVSSAVPDELVPHFPSPSFVPPPPYHTVVSEGAAEHPSTTYMPLLSRKPSNEPCYQRSRQPSTSLASGTVRVRVRSRPPLPIGPRKPNKPGQSINSIIPGVHGRNGSSSSVGSSNPAGSLGFPWRKLHSAASKPPPKFQAPPPKWRGLTLEAAQWTFTSAQLQEIVSQAIQQSSEGSALRFLRPDILEGEVADEMQRLELQQLDVKAQYKALARKRWMLMGALAGHVEGVERSDVTTAAHTVEELAEVLSALDSLADKMHDVILQMSQLRSLRDAHNTSALAMAIRKINALFVRQIAEKEQLQEQVDTLRTERNEAWKHAEDIAQDYDVLNDRVSESACGDAKTPNGDASSTVSSRRSTRILAVRKSSHRLSQAGLRSRSRHRVARSPGSATRPTSLVLDDIPPVPPLPPSGMSYGSAHGNTPGMSAAQTLDEAQREVYEMLGLSVPPSQASSRRRTLSSSAASRPPTPKSRPTSESLDGRARGVRRVQSRQEWGLATKSVVLDDRYHVRPLSIARG